MLTDVAEFEGGNAAEDFPASTVGLFVAFPYRSSSFTPQNELTRLNMGLVFVLQTVGDDGERPAAFSQAAPAAEIHSERPDGGSSDRAAL